MSQNVPTPQKPENSKPKRRYKKRIRKVSPNEGFLSDSKEETKDIPLYDPFTGEPNPYYEELTGKPNPLTRPKGFTIDNVAENSRNLCSPMLKEINNEPTTEFLDVKTNNRFLVIFPEEFGVKPFYVKSIKRPKMVAKHKKMFGILCYVNSEVSPVEVEMIDLIDDNKLNVKINDIFQSNKFFEFKIQILTPHGLVTEEMIFKHCFISEIMFSPLSYSDDSLSTITLKINPRSYSII